MMNKLNMETPNVSDINFEVLSNLFPNAVTEAKNENGEVVRAIDVDVLRQEISCPVVDGREERYQFTWPDKSKNIHKANSPISETLRPVKEESVSFDNTKNIYIEGDNLNVLKLLQETYLEKIQLIYIDPPYNTGHDFVYRDDFRIEENEYMNNSGQLDNEGNRLVTNLESNGRFHTDWLNMIFPRIQIARTLLKEDGVMFISIDDNELDDVLKICKEIFGHNNVMACFPRVTKKAGKTTDDIAKNHDYIIACRKGDNPSIYLPSHTDEGFKYEDEYVEERGKYKLNQTLDYDSLQYSSSLDYPIEIEGMTLYPGQSYEKYLERKNGNHARADWAWRWSKELFEFGLKNGFIVVKKYDSYARIYTKTYQNAKIVKKGASFEIEYYERTKPISTLEFVENEYSNDNAKKNLISVFGSSVFDYSKPVALLKTLIQYATKEGDIVMDFFSGSGTTGQAVMELSSETGQERNFILVQLPELTDESSDAYKAGFKNICEIGKERLRITSNKNTNSNTDTGFRVFVLDSSNMKDVFYRPVETEQNLLDMFADNIKPDRKPEDLLFQVMLDLGVPLSSKIEEKEISGKKVFFVAEGFLIACFDKDVTEETVKAVAEKKPYYAVFRDSSMADDSVATNFDQIFDVISPETERRVL